MLLPYLFYEVLGVGALIVCLAIGLAVAGALMALALGANEGLFSNLLLDNRKAEPP